MDAGEEGSGSCDEATGLVMAGDGGQRWNGEGRERGTEAAKVGSHALAWR